MQKNKTKYLNEKKWNGKGKEYEDYYQDKLIF